MTIFDLPEEPNSPAGQAIQTAQNKTTSDKFMMVLKSNVHLGDTISNTKFNLATKEITFTASETGDYLWFDWLLSVPQDESVTLFILDSAGTVRYCMIMEGIYIFDHECLLDEFNVNQVEHTITVQFTNIERINPTHQL